MNFLPELEFVEAVERAKDSGELAQKRREKNDRENLDALYRGLAGRLPSYVQRTNKITSDVVHLADHKSSKSKRPD